MRNFLVFLIKYVIKILVVLAITSVLVVIISMKMNLKLSDVFLFAGIICMVIGVYALQGNLTATSKYNNVMTQNMYSKSVDDAAKENVKSLNSSYRFLIFVSITGFLLLLISHFIG